VDTAHAVLGNGTDAAGTYVAMTRGREHNTAWTVTRPLGSDAAPGSALDVEARTARAVLTDVLAAAQEERSALAEVEQAALEAGSTQTHLDRLADGIALATAGRTAAVLDRLTTDGALDPTHRAALAADEAFDSLQRLLRTAELAGHNPDVVLNRAVAGRGLDDARSPAQVLHHRITTSLNGHLTPRMSSAADLIPADIPPEWAAWLHERAIAADDRRRELGAEIAAQPPQWAELALGPVPEDAVARLDWEHRAGWAGAYRELADHTDAQDPLGAAPPAGLAEKAVAFRAAHNALDLPDLGAEEANLTDGRLRLRADALDREETWAPRWVADELDATHQAAEHRRTDAALWAARADVTEDPAAREQLRLAAHTADQEAHTLAERAAQLELADQARAAWFAHTAATRDAAIRARTELAARGVDRDDPTDRVTADEWRDAHRAEERDTDADREIRDEHELQDHEETQIVGVPDGRAVETGVDDIRDTAIPENKDADDVRTPDADQEIPTVDETTAAVARAQDALAEITNRQQADDARAARDAQQRARRAELAQWAEQDRAAGQDRDDELVRER